MRGMSLLAAVAVVATPVAVYSQNQGAGASKKRNEATRRVCRVQGDIGSRLGRTVRCATNQENANRQQDERRTIERVQALKPTFGS